MNYVLLGDIQNEVIKHYETFEHSLDFLDAVKILIKQDKVYNDTPVYPDFLSWNTTDLPTLKTLIRLIPVDIETLPFYNSPDFIKVHINLELFTFDQLRARPYITIYYVLSGTATYYTETDTQSLDTGNLLIISPNLSHKIYSTPDDYVFQIIMAPDLFEEHFSSLLSQNQVLSTFFYQSLYHEKKNSLRFHMLPNPAILDIIKHLFSEFTSPEAFSTEIFLSYLQIIYAMILRNCDVTYTVDNLRPNISIMPALLVDIQKNYKDLSLEILATKFNYDTAYLSRLIKQETGKNFIDIIQGHKIKEATELLLHTSYSIGRISELVGYNSADHFTRSFKKVVGQTPREMRRMNQ